MRRLLRKIATKDTKLGDTSTLADPKVVERLVKLREEIDDISKTQSKPRIDRPFSLSAERAELAVKRTPDDPNDSSSSKRRRTTE